MKLVNSSNLKLNLVIHNIILTELIEYFRESFVATSIYAYNI